MKLLLLSRNHILFCITILVNGYSMTKKLLSDAGKSTIGGQMMYLTGMVDKRTLEKYEKEAKEKNRETWYLSWCMDTNMEGQLYNFCCTIVIFLGFSVVFNLFFEKKNKV